MAFGRTGVARYGFWAGILAGLALLAPMSAAAAKDRSHDPSNGYRLARTAAWHVESAGAALAPDEVEIGPANADWSTEPEPNALTLMDRLLTIQPDLRFVINGSIENGGPERLALGLHYAAPF